MATWVIKYGYGKPGVQEETFEGTYREAFQYAADHAHGWGFTLNTTMTIEKARQGCKELFEEGYGFDAVRIYLNDLSRGKDITWEENRQLQHEIMDGKLGNGEFSYGTF